MKEEKVPQSRLPWLVGKVLGELFESKAVLRQIAWRLQFSADISTGTNRNHRLPMIAIDLGRFETTFMS